MVTVVSSGGRYAGTCLHVEGSGGMGAPRSGPRGHEAEDRAEYGVRKHDARGRLKPVMESQEPGRLEPPDLGRARARSSHARVEPWERRQRNRNHESAVDHADRRPKSGGSVAGRTKDPEVDEREDPAVHEVERYPEHLRAVAVRSQHRPEQVRQVHPGEPEPLRSSQDRREEHGRPETPREPAFEGHARASVPRPAFSSARARSASASAAEMSPTCVNACGKLPSASPVAGSISSANSPTSFARERSAVIQDSASARVPPPRARNSTAQNEQIPKAPSPAARLSS